MQEQSRPMKNTGEGAGGSTPPQWNLQTEGSRLVERMLEYQFLAGLTAELLRRGMRFEVLRGDFDHDGHDVVVEAGGVMRHIQLKGMKDDGKSVRVPVNLRLRDKPAGCVIWMSYDPRSLSITGWRWFGCHHGGKLPDPGDRVGQHTRGKKAFRPHIRVLPARRFQRVPDIAALADLLFGSLALCTLRQHLRNQPADPAASAWSALVQSGDFASIPACIDWDGSTELACMMDGYVLAEELGLGDPMEFEEMQLAEAMRTGVWPGDAARLWVTLFLEHRRWHFSGGFSPDPEMQRLLDGLVGQLRTSLAGES